MPYDPETRRVTAERPEPVPTMLVFFGGPFGKRPYQLPHEPVAGFVIVMKTDGAGNRLLEPIKYVVQEQRPDGSWRAGYAGKATEREIESWNARVTPPVRHANL